MQATAVLWNGIKERALGMRKMMMEQRAGLADIGSPMYRRLPVSWVGEALLQKAWNETETRLREAGWGQRIHWGVRNGGSLKSCPQSTQSSFLCGTLRCWGWS